MWLPWTKSPGRSPWTKSPGRSPSHNAQLFACSSFKDIQKLCKEDLEPKPQKKSNIFQRVRIATAVLRSLSRPSTKSLPPIPSPSPPTPSQPDPAPPPNSVSLPGGEKRIVVYYTSLRVIRKTFEDCKNVLLILRGFRVSLDERDISMDASLLEELQMILGSKELTLPRVFIGGRYMGGAEEIRQLHETGELKRFVEGFPAAENGVCDECGGFRFILCDQCNGSHKCYIEKGGFKICPSCNVNGLIRCPSCYSSLGVDTPKLK